MKKSNLAFALILLACGCTREVYLQEVPCEDCQPCEEDICKEPVQEVQTYEFIEPAPAPEPAPVCQPTCPMPACVYYPCPVVTCTPCATVAPVVPAVQTYVQPVVQPVVYTQPAVVMPTYTVPVMYY